METNNTDHVAWHDTSIRVSDFFIRVDLTPYGMPGRFEQLWVKEELFLFRVCSVPFFTYGISLGDLVETSSDFTFLRVVTKCGHRVLRIAIANKSASAHLHSLIHEWVVTTGLIHEWYSSDGYLAVDVPPNVADPSKVQLIEELSRAGDIFVEIHE